MSNGRDQEISIGSQSCQDEAQMQTLEKGSEVVILGLFLPECSVACNAYLAMGLVHNYPKLSMNLYKQPSYVIKLPLHDF